MTGPGWALPPAGVADWRSIEPERETSWLIDGVPLSTFCWDVKTKGGSRAKPPPLRGEDTTIPFSPGKLDAGRVPDARLMDLQMWVTGAAQDGRVIDERAYERNHRALVGLCWNPDRPVALTKRFYDADGQLVDVTALARYADGLEPSMTGPARADVTVTFLLPDPFFYADWASVLLPVPGTRTVPVPGDVTALRIVLKHDSPFQDLRIRNLTTGSGFTHQGIVPAGAGVRIEAKNFRAVISPAAGPEYLDNAHLDQASAGSISPWLLTLARGDNTLQLTAGAGRGEVQLDYQAAYL